MGKKLFVSNLDFAITVEQLREVFSEAGNCLNVVIAADRETKRPKGFAFIEMERDDQALAAIEQINGKAINGRPIKVVEDRGRTVSLDGPDGENRQRGEMLQPIQRMQLFKRRKKLDPFMEDPNKTVDYKDVTILSKFLSERGKILSRRLTGLTAYNQRKVSKAIKRAQNMGLLPFTTIYK